VDADLRAVRDAAVGGAGCLKINIEGFTDQGAGLGEVCVDDVYVGRGREGQP